MATCLNGRTTNMKKKLTIVDVMCPVCRGIFIEPVIMPCQHGLCLQCFERTMEETSLTCPMCRKRIGSWLRTATKDHKLVNNELWAVIQKQFPEQVQAKLNGEDDGVEERVVGKPSPCISSSGEIRKEYEQHIQQQEEETRKKVEAERLANEELIRQLQEEDEKQYFVSRQQMLNQTLADEQMAKELYEQSIQLPGYSISPLQPQKVGGTYRRKRIDCVHSLLLEALTADPTQPTTLFSAVHKSTSSGNLTSKKDIGLRLGMDNKENKNRIHSGVIGQIKGPMDSFVFSQQKKITVPTGKFLSTSDSYNIKFGSSKLKAGPVSELEKVRSVSNLSASSHDSINQEMHHFKPIKSVPRTPPKKLSDGRVLVPVVVKAVPVNLNPMYESSNESSSSNPFIRQQLLKVYADRTRNLKGVLRTSEMNPPVSAFRGKASCWKKSEPFRLGYGSSEKEKNTEDAESPRKKLRKDAEDQRSNFSFPGLSSYSDEECKGKKVIAIVHNQGDALVEAAGKVGGHDRRFGGSEREDSCSYSKIGKVRDRDDDDDDSNSDLDPNYSDPVVTRVIGVEPEYHSQSPTETKCQKRISTSTKHGSSSPDVKVKMVQLSPAEQIPSSHCQIAHVSYRNNTVKKVHYNINNNTLSTVTAPDVHTKTQQSSVPNRNEDSGKDNLDEILIDESDSSLLPQEQAHIEMMIRQEQEDLKLALKLQQEWDIADRRVDRSKGSLRAYELRNANKSQNKNKKAAKKGQGRQSTLEESFTGAHHTVKRR